MTPRRKLEIAGAVAVGLVRAAADGARIMFEAGQAIRGEFRLALLLADRGLSRDEVMIVATPSNDWVVLPDGTSERIG